MTESVRITQIFPSQQTAPNHSLCHTTCPEGTSLSPEETPFLQQGSEVLRNNLQVLLMPPPSYCKSYPCLAGTRTPDNGVWFRRCSLEAKLVSEQCRMFLLSQAILENVRWTMLGQCMDPWTLYPAMSNTLYFIGHPVISVVWKLRKGSLFSVPLHAKLHVYMDSGSFYSVEPSEIYVEIYFFLS